MEMCYISRSLPSILTLGLLFWGLTVPGPGDLGAAAAGGPVMGGPCKYKSYPGRAQIISIQPIISPEKTETTFEVRYSFQPEGKIIEPFAQTEGRIFLLTMKNGTYLSKKFLEKYKIETGRIFECLLQVIIQGTCTPTLFELAGIDLSDYGTR